MYALIPRLLLLISALSMLAACEQQANEASSPTVAAAMVDRGKHWSALNAISNPAEYFAVSAAVASQYEVGEELQFKVHSARDGFLHIVQVDSTDAVSALLPHQAFASNAVKAGQEFVYPPALSGIKISAREPLGNALLAFIVTRDNLPTAQVIPELFGNQAAGRGLTLVSDATTSAGTARWSLAKYTISIVSAPQP